VSKATEHRAVRDLVARVRRTVVDRAMLKGGETVLVAVSGGPDSLALLHVLARLARAFDLVLHVAHFDHRLRAGSAADAAFVSRAAARLGLPATIRAAETTDTPHGLSPEEAARERRLAFLDEVADAAGAARIATGHTLDDQAETVLMRILVGGGRRGLGGIPPVRGRFMRPLIDARRSQTEAFCRALRLRPRRDPMNEDPAFLRNLLRLEVVPLLEERVNARLAETLARLADVMRDEDAYLDQRAAEALAADVAEGGLRVPVEHLLALPPALQRRVLRRTAALGADHVERLRALALEGETGDAIDLPGPLNARLEYGWLIVGRPASPPSRGTEPVPVSLTVPGETDLPSWRLRATAWVSAVRPGTWPDGRRACVLDASRVSLPLRARGPKPGDRFRPLGAPGVKKLGDFFTDAKVPRERRAGTPLVVDASDEIVWVVGHRIDDRAKVTARSARYVWLEVEDA
jgi:tRNA(Ile)-lysidine synthase